MRTYRKMKNLLAVLLAVSISLTAMTACGSTAESEPTQSPAPVQADPIPFAEAPAEETPADTPELPADPAEESTESAEETAPKADGQLGSWSGGGTDASSPAGNDYAYDAALFVTSAGIDGERSSADRISSGVFNDENAENIDLLDKTAGHNGFVIADTNFTVTRSIVELISNADGSGTCDRTGLGSVIAAFGSQANVTVSDSYLHSSGVAAMPVFADDGATVTIRSSVLQSDGGTLYEAYMNTTDPALAAAPPWTLGIMGTSRCANLMGDGTTLNLIDSTATSGAWGVLSTDSESPTTLNVINSELGLNYSVEKRHLLQAGAGQISETKDDPYTVNSGTGYGTLVTGGAAATFLGSRLFTGTYATVFAGGNAVYAGLESGKTYELTSSSGETAATYTAAESRNTEIRSDSFGFLAQQGSNSISIEKGTVIASAYATFLVKTGFGAQSLVAAVDDAEMTNGGVLIQVMDNEEAAIGMMDKNDKQNTDHGTQNYKAEYNEAAGFSVAQVQADEPVQIFTFTNGVFFGNIYNASGSNGLKGSTLNVTFGEGSTYKGAIASTSAIHVSFVGSEAVKENGGFALDDAETAADFAEKYQITHFTINEYWNLGHVANLVNFNGANVINVTLTDDALWMVTGTSLISSLTIYGNGQIIVPEDITLTVNGTEYTGCTITASTLAG